MGKRFAEGPFTEFPSKPWNKTCVCNTWRSIPLTHLKHFMFHFSLRKNVWVFQKPNQWSLLFYLVSAPFIVPDKSKKRESGKKAYLLISAAHYSHLVKKIKGSLSQEYPTILPRHFQAFFEISFITFPFFFSLTYSIFQQMLFLISNGPQASKYNKQATP